MSGSGANHLHKPIAIVGVGCRFPGGVTDASSYWQLLINGVDAITDIPADRFDTSRYFDARPGTPGRIVSGRGGFVQQAPQLVDAEFFGISERYAECLDPQQRLLLETSWEAFEDAGFDVSLLNGSRTGVFVGAWTSDFEHQLFSDHDAIDFPATLGSGRYAAAGRLSYTFGFRGESLSVDAACSSGLAAVHLAVRSLRSGDSTLALACGVNVILQPHIHIAYSQSGMLAPDGRCKFGDASGDGYVRSEGAGVVVLKPLADALRDGDRVYAVIRGSALNNDGDSSQSLGRPSATGHEEVLRAALRDAGVRAREVAYVEAHGTGTRAGDPVEISALAQVLSEGRAEGSRVWVGSVKTNIGHTEGAAGLAGLIKGALMLQHGAIPPSLHFNVPNPSIPWEQIPLAVATDLIPWPDAYESRVMGVSSFGIGGTNVHVVLEAAPPQHVADTLAPDLGSTGYTGHTGDTVIALAAANGPSLSNSSQPFVLPLSARSDAALRALALRCAERMSTGDALHAADFCYAAATRRSALTHRAVFVATATEELIASLQAFAHGAPPTAAGTSYNRASLRVAFVVPGQGSQWVGMARELLTHSSVFRATMQQCDAVAHRYFPWSVLEQIHASEGAPDFLGNRIEVIQPTLTALALSYAAWLRSIGVTPDAVVGHSFGEIAAAAIAGAIDIATAMRITCQRGALLQREGGHGAMAVVELADHDVRTRVDIDDDHLSIAAINSPTSTVITGDVLAVQEAVTTFEHDNVFVRRVQVDVAAHSPQMQSLSIEMRDLLHDVRPREGDVVLYSTVTGNRIAGLAMDADYWSRNLREPVQFKSAIQAMIHDGIGAFVELAPHPVLTQAVEQTARGVGRTAVAVACGRRLQADTPTALGAIARLWTAGAAIDWKRVLRPASTASWSSTGLPLYPWQRQRYWPDRLQPSGRTRARTPHRSPLNNILETLHAQHWLPAPVLSTRPYDESGDQGAWQWLIVEGAGNAGGSLAEALRARGERAAVVESMSEAAGFLIAGFSGHPPHAMPLGIVVLPVADADVAFSPVLGLTELQNALAGEHVLITPRVWWVTVGAHATPGALAEPHCGERAAAWGAARVLATEHPAWWGGLIDLEPQVALTAQSVLLASHLCDAGNEDHVALRNGERLALRIEPVKASIGPFRWTADSAYLITGAFGGVAQHLAAEMIRDGARRLILMTRSPLPPRNEWSTVPAASPDGERVAAVQALEQRGATVYVMTCADVSSETAVRAAVAQYDAGGWPSIAGVIHCAAILDNQLSHYLSSASFQRVLSPKLRGAEVLDRVFPALDVFVLMSSVSSIVPQAGMTNYTAANAGSDALASARRSRGQRAVSIQWCGWEATGMNNHDRGELDCDALARIGVLSLTPGECASLFSTIVNLNESVVSVLPFDTERFIAAGPVSTLPRFRTLFDRPRAEFQPQPTLHAPAGRTPDDHTDRGVGTIARQLLDGTSLERATLLESLVRDTLSSILRVPAERIENRRTFGSLGFDSLMSLDLRNRLEERLRRPLPATLAWNYPTIESLTAYLSAEGAGAAPRAQVAAPLSFASRQPPVTDFAQLLNGIAGLSEEDARRALRGAQADQ